MGLKATVSAEEFERLPEPEEAVRRELDEGDVITLAPASEEHGDVAAEILFRLKLFLKEHPLGKVYAAETGFRLAKDTVRAPDVAFVRKERFDPAARRRFLQGPPDLAIEVFSPSDSVPQLMRKVRQFRAAGCILVWVDYPDTRTVHVFFQGGEDRVLGPDDMLDAPGLLPGFAVPVRDLFPA